MKRSLSVIRSNEASVAIEVPREVYELVIKPMLKMLGERSQPTTPAQNPLTDQALAFLDESEGAFLSRLIDLKPGNQRAPWAGPLLRTLLDKMQAKGRAADRHKEDLRRRLRELDPPSLARLLNKRSAPPRVEHQEREAPDEIPTTIPSPVTEFEAVHTGEALVEVAV